MELKDMKIKTFKEFLEDKTNPVVYCLLSSNGKDFLAKESYKVELHQYNCQHDTFTIETPEDSFDAFNEYIMEHSRDLLGEPLTIKFYQYGKVVQHFSGIITRIYCKRQTGGGYGTLYISGNAPSILLDQGKACHSYEHKTLKEIIALVSEGYDNSAQADSSAGVNTTRALPYTVQYNESDYDFICRLANLYGEYFYYDGSKLIFGNKLQETIDLGENLNLIDEDFNLEMKPQDFEYINYAIDRAEVYRKDAESACCEYKNNPIQTDAKNASKKLFKKIPQKYHSATSLEQSDIDLEEVVRQERDLRELSLKVTGQSRDPRLRMNTFACLTDINARAMETYRVIKISHYHSGMNYENSFEGIPMMRTPADYNAEAFPKAEQQPAIVKDNNDPQGMGRVRVQFFWQKGDELSPWIRMIQPYAGSGKGFYFIPEVGEEVMVDFENGNAERPFVLGAHYNGAAKSGYKPTTKAIHTKSGTKILLNDAEGSVRIEDASGNIYQMDGNGTIEVKAPKNIIFTAGEDLKFSAGRNMTTNVANNLTTNVGNEIIQDSGRKTTFSSGTDIQVAALRDIDIYGKEKLIGYTDGKTELGAKERMHIYGTNSLITAQDKIEYKAPKMNKLPEQGEFRYNKEKRIISAEWMNNDIEQNIDTAYIGEKVSLLVRTRNYEEGEAINIIIKERDGKDVTNGKQEVILTGIVDNEGYAILKESMNIEYSEREEQRVLERQREKEAKEAELRRSRELFSKHCTFEED
nr:type VI secretion system Vgr family protein [uncultured Capnocytophaga sp.]